MIPKIIHYSWFSGEPYPDDLQRCMDTWPRVLPDYELRLWDGRALREIGNTFANEAVSARKWAFAADFLRLYAVHRYGGIWLDTDVEMFRSFDRFLNDPMFIGREYYVSHDGGRDTCALTAHCFGAEAGHPFVEECLEYYEHRHFIRSRNERLPERLRYDMTIIPRLMQAIAEREGYDASARHNAEQTLAGGIHIYPYQWFDQPGYTSMSNVVCIHRVAQSWNPAFGNKGINKRATDLKHKNLSYYKMQTQQALIRWIRKL